MHAGFLIGLFVIFLWICFKFLSILIQEKDYLFKDCDKIADKVQKPEVYSIVLLKNLKNNLEFQKLIIFSIFAFLSFLATLITPYGLELYSFLSGYSNTYYLTHISEWLPFYYSPILYWQLLYSAFVVLAIGLMFKYKKISDIQKWYIFLSIIFFFLAFKSRRHFPLFFIVSFPLLIQFFYKFFKLPPKVGQYITSSLIIKFYIVLCFLLLIVYQIVTINPVRDPFVKFEKGYPIKAIEFIKNHPEYLNKRTLSKYRWGGYLTWVLPENKLFIDGRLPQYEFGGHTMLQEYYEFYQEGQARRKLNEHKIELVLISSQIKQSEPDWFEKHFLNVFQNDIEKPKYYLKDYLDNSGAWEMVYEDEISVIYIKNN